MGYPNRSFTVLKLASPDALHNKLAAHSIFLAGRYVAEGCSLLIPFAVFRHATSRYQCQQTSLSSNGILHQRENLVKALLL